MSRAVIPSNSMLTASRFNKRIEDAYIHANKTLLKLMIDEQELIPHLRYVIPASTQTA